MGGFSFFSLIMAGKDLNAKAAAEQIFLAGIKSVLPDQLIRTQVFIQDSILFISSHRFPLKNINRIFVIGAGKASALMAKEIEEILADRVTDGHIVVKYGHACELKKITVTEAGHPMPDRNGVMATQKILKLATHSRENDLIICLLSGGGSALLIDFPEGKTLDDAIVTNDLLTKSGADIKEVNTVRKHLSNVKGGQLAKAAQPGRLVSLILSDVIGDPLDVIASGPTVPDPTTFDDALLVLRKYDLLSKVPQQMLAHLQKGANKLYPETPKPGDSAFNNTLNLIIGSNEMALEAASKKAKAMGFNPVIITSVLEGDADKIANQIVAKAIQFQKDSAVKKPNCLLFGGEPTLKVNGTGTGGRNQHLALLAALLLKDHEGITVLCGGTDGSDGPTTAAGAVVDSKTVEHASSIGVGIQKYLNNFDSFHFFERAGGHIITGPTMTNVMDLIIVIIE
jgi:glycerate 2-kinase